MDFSLRNLLEMWIKDYKLCHIRQVTNWISVAVNSWRSESSNISLVILYKLTFVKKKSITYGANEVESLLDTDNRSSNMLSF